MGDISQTLTTDNVRCATARQSFLAATGIGYSRAGWYRFARRDLMAFTDQTGRLWIPRENFNSLVNRFRSLVN